jgi:hypothetical protein
LTAKHQRENEIKAKPDVPVWVELVNGSQFPNSNGSFKITARRVSLQDSTKQKKINHTEDKSNAAYGNQKRKKLLIL